MNLLIGLKKRVVKNLIMNSKKVLEIDYKKIEDWDKNNPHTLLEFIIANWRNKESLEEQLFMNKEASANIIVLELHTDNVPENEKIIESLKKTIFWDAWWHSTTKGGQYRFEIVPSRYGFKLVSDFSEETGISRQMIYRYKDKYDWIELITYKTFVRYKKEAK